MTRPETISVALCTHNGERFLRQQLLSIFEQSLLPDEIVISDDASTDRTLEIVSETIAGVPARSAASRVAVNLLRNPAAVGIVANFQSAISACTGDLIALCDQDDEWVPGRLERVRSEFERRPDLVLLHSDAVLIDGEGEPLGGTVFETLGVDSRFIAAVHGGDAWSVLLKRNIATGATIVFRRSLIAVALPIPDGWLHDEWLTIVAAAVLRVDLIAEPLVRYRQHGSNEVGAQNLSELGRFKRMIEPGTERNARLLERAASLCDRLPSLPGISTAKMGQSVAKLEHERVRSSLRRHRLARVAPVVRELRTGRYTTYGRGPSDAARDLLQPLGSRDYRGDNA